MTQPRQLAAIMFTDIVGYTAMMQADEAKTVAIIKHYTAALEKWVSQFNGQVLNYYGDGSLCIFPNATDATNCSLAVQKELKTEPPVPLRIGLHIGEVFFEGDKALGDGVNVASRIQSLGQENTILTSGEFNDKIKNNSAFTSTSLGQFDFKNVDKPLEVFALTNEGLFVPKRSKLDGKLKKKSSQKQSMIIAASVLLLAIASFFIYKNSLNTTEEARIIAVLPFTNMSPDKENEFFAAGVHEDVMINLASLNGIKVISRTSVLQYKEHKAI